MNKSTEIDNQAEVNQHPSLARYDIGWAEDEEFMQCAEYMLRVYGFYVDNGLVYYRSKYEVMQ